MDSQTLSLVVAGAEKRLLLDTDPTSGRTAVRLDGRPVTRPIGPDEEEREFTVASQKFILRRMPNGRFEVDYAPPDFSPGSVWAGPRPTRNYNKGWKPAAGGVFGVILLFVIGRGANVCTRVTVRDANRALERVEKRVQGQQVDGQQLPPSPNERSQPAPQPAQVYTPPPTVTRVTQPVERTPSAPSTERPVLQMAQAAQVYVVNATKTYYPMDCAARPDGSYKMAKSLATSQGYKLAAECAKSAPRGS